MFFHYLDVLAKRMLDKDKIKEVEKAASTKDKLQCFIKAGIKREDVIDGIEKYYSVKYIDLKKIQPTIKMFEKISEETLKSINEQKVFIFDEDDNTLGLVVGNLPCRDTIKEVENTTKLKFNNYFAFDYEIKEKLNIPRTKKEIISNSIQNVDDWFKEIVYNGAINNASDIHIESKKNYMSIRYRIDGVLSKKQIYNMTEEDMSKIYIKIKLMSELNIAEKRKPQDGRIGNFTSNNTTYDIRVSTVLTVFGEKIVLRLIDKSEKIMSLKEIGFSDAEINRITNLLDRQNGIIYVSGPTGSGKTTTLYGMIDYKNSDDINLYTIEDPVERAIENINQTSINPQAEITYASTLRALLRQDPDVIVVGEIRDEETAELSSRGSLAGHLIIATIHANKSIETLARLNNLGLDNYAVSTTTLGVISQRLTRTLCNECKKVHELTEKEREWLSENGFEEKITYEATGCHNCDNGHNGRTVIAEIFEVNDEVKESIMRDDSISKMEEYAKKNGFESFKEVAYSKAINGEISLKEAIHKSN